MNSEARDILVLAGRQYDLSRFKQAQTTLRLPDGRTFVLPLEVREDGLHCQLSEDARAALGEYAHAPKNATLPTYPIVNFRDSKTGDLTEFLMSTGEISRFALSARPPVNLWQEPVRRLSKGAQRRMGKPWHRGRNGNG